MRSTDFGARRDERRIAVARRAATALAVRGFRVRAREAHLVMADGDQVAVAQADAHGRAGR